MEKENKHYVYVHKTLVSNVVFYVGKGVDKRAWNTRSRTQAWIDTASGGYIVEILKNNLSFAEAEDFEAELLEQPPTDWELVNITKGRIPSKLLDICNNVYYDKTSPTFLRWKFSTVRGKRKVDGVAGSVFKNKYANLMIDRKQYAVHRIIWTLFNQKEIPRGYVVNHIDCNPSNNSIENLEAVTFAVNARTKKCHALEHTGVNKTSSCPNGTTKYYSYTGSCTIDNKMVNKSFSILKYGEAEAFRLACEWRKEQIRLLNEQGAGYTERHGT